LSRSRSKKRLKGVFERALKHLLRLFVILWIFTMAQVLVLRFVNPPFTVSTAWSWVQSKFSGTHYGRPHYHWRALEEISPHLKRAVVAAEDQRFLSHHGFDFIEIGQALNDIFKVGKVRGASTITMQVARTVFLWPGRNWLRKISEAYYTVVIEIFWSKERILEIYLNTVDWGPGIMGAEAATRRYFTCHADQISPSQAAILAAILPSPHGWSPTHPNQRVLERQKRILNDMGKMPLL
jgi:monofunctional biosynthetic peptidoglycan transglycosylase